MPTFNDLLKKALAVEREHRELTSLAGQKLSARAYLAQAMKNARCDAKDLVRLRQEFEATDGPVLDAARFALRRFLNAARSPNYPWPPADSARLRHLIPDGAAAELVTVHATPMQVFALAVQTACQRYPESFGSVESHDAWKQTVKDLERERVELYARIATTYDLQQDVIVDDLDATGRARVAFRVSGGAVPIYPKENAAERLLAFLLDNPAAEAAI